jgi:hypothetical protein
MKYATTKNWGAIQKKINIGVPSKKNKKNQPPPPKQ